MKSLPRFYCVLCLLLVFADLGWTAKFSEPTLTTTSKTTTEPPTKLIECPDEEVIFPCICFHQSSTAVDDNCNDRSVTQETLNNLFFQLRLVNNLTLNQILEFGTLEIYQSGITQLDLTPFMNLRLTRSLYITDLTSIVGPPISPVVIDIYDNSTSEHGRGQVRLNQRSIMVQRLELIRCSLTAQGFGDALKYFDGDFMVQLRVVGGQIQGGHYPIGDGSGDVEFFPGLSEFVKLKTLEVDSRPNKTEISGGGQFKRHTHLESLWLDWENSILGDDAFLFDEPPPELLNTTTEIKFFGRPVTNSYFNGVSRLAKSSRPITLNFQQSTMDFLSEVNFKAFLLDSPENKIDLLDCHKVICDARMKWLKDNPDIYKPRVPYSQCSNDPEKKSIFETNLIP